MEKITFKKTDISKLAANDVADYSNWAEKQLKPGEQVIVQSFKNYASALNNRLKHLNKLLVLKQKEFEYIQNYSVNSDKEKSREVIIKGSLERLQDDLKHVRSEQVKVDEAITRLRIKYPDLREPVKLISDNIVTPVKRPKGWFAKKRKSIFLVAMLIVIALFDAYNMNIALENYEHNAIKYKILSMFIFFAILLCSFAIKKKSTPKIWLGLLFFLSIANAPQFLGRDPKFGIQNLLDSPTHVIIFLTSFGGSIVITLLNSKRNVNAPKMNNTDASSAPDVQLDGELRYKELLDKRDILKSMEQVILSKISDKEKQIEEIFESYEVGERKTLNEKIEAFQKLDEEQTQVDDEIKLLESDLEDIPRDLKYCIEEYRQEVDFIRLIHDIPKMIGYKDIDSINI